MFSLVLLGAAWNVWRRHRRRRTTPVATLLAHWRSTLRLTPLVLTRVCEALLDDFSRGLDDDDQDLHMLPSFIPATLTGSETGVYYGIDLGGTNWRVVRAMLHGHHRLTTTIASGDIPRALYVTSIDQLFTFLASQLRPFVQDPTAAINVGFSFSFPTTLRGSPREAFVMYWTKGFQITGGEDESVAVVLTRAHVPAVVNDALAPLLYAQYTTSRTRIQNTKKKQSLIFAGAIFGTGTNLSLVEDGSRIPKLAAWRHVPGYVPGPQLINTEWSNARRELPTIPEDERLDAISDRPGMGQFEKRIGGLALGKLTALLLNSYRRALVESGLGSGSGSESESGWREGRDNTTGTWTLTTRDVEFLATRDTVAETARGDHDDDCVHLDHCRQVHRLLVDVLGWPTALVSQPAVRRDVREIAALVLYRAGQLAGAGVAAAWRYTSRTSFDTSASIESTSDTAPGEGLDGPRGADGGSRPTVGVDGSLVLGSVTFRRGLRDAVVTLMGESGRRLRLCATPNASVVGSALAAAALVGGVGND